MTETSSIPSVVDRTRHVKADAPVVGAHFLGSTAVFVLGEETLLFVDPKGEERRVAVHGGGILCSAADGKRIVTGGDDGKVVSTDAKGDTSVIAATAKATWVDHVTVANGGNGVAWSAGRSAHVQRDGQGEQSIELPSTVGALAFLPKGFRLAVAHYNGVTLWFSGTKAEPEWLEWKGSHLAVKFSPDGRFVVTAMQEPQLHGWRLADRKDMRMQGYSSRVRSLDWSADGKWLATSGSTQVILWPFQSKDGPMGKTPQLLAPTEYAVEMVACHPKQAVVAAGYADGLILLIRIDDGAEVLARKPGDAPVSALAWSADGRMLAFGTEDGTAGVIDLG